MKTKTLEQLQAELKTAQLKHELAMLQNKNRWDYTNETKLEISKFDKAEKQILAMLKGWNITDVQCLLIHRVLPAAKQSAKVA